MNILAIDPGLTSGVALLTGKVLTTREVQGGAVPMLDVIWGMAHGVDAIVIERYTINAGTKEKTRQYDPLYIIGGVLWMGEYAQIPVVLQNPGLAKGFSTDDKLRKVRWYDRAYTKDGHALDATRHLLVYAVGLEQYGYLREALVA